MGKNIIVLIVLLFVCSCQTKPAVWDKSIPEESMSTLKLNNIKITSYNGEKASKFNWIKIPAGDTTLVGDYLIYHASIGFSIRGMEFTYRFEEGKEYFITGSHSYMRWGVSIYEGISQERHIAFIPFTNQPEKLFTGAIQ